MPEPIIELPLLESSLWEGLVVATAEGELAEAQNLAGLLDELGYEVAWEHRAVRLTHSSSGQQLLVELGGAQGY